MGPFIAARGVAITCRQVADLSAKPAWCHGCSVVRYRAERCRRQSARLAAVETAIRVARPRVVPAAVRKNPCKCSSTMALHPRPNCLRLLPHCPSRAASRAACTAGSNSAIRIPMIVMTTNKSTKVKPLPLGKGRLVGRASSPRGSDRTNRELQIANCELVIAGPSSIVHERHESSSCPSWMLDPQSTRPSPKRKKGGSWGFYRRFRQA